MTISEGIKLKAVICNPMNLLLGQITTFQAEYLPLDLATAGFLSNDLFCSFIALIN